MGTKLVKLLEQGQLRQNNWTNNQGQQVVISSVELKFTDGINSFYAEVSDQMAINITQNPLQVGSVYAIKFTLAARKWENKDHVEMHATNIRITHINLF